MARSVELVVALIQQMVSEGIAAQEIADLLMPTFDSDVVADLARAYVHDSALEVVRSHEYGARRRALFLSPPRPSETVKHGNKRMWRKGCRCDECERWMNFCDEIETESRQRFTEKIRALTADYSATLRAQWTAELLESTFGTPDGRVTWADATVEDHRAHVEMNVGHIEGYVRDSALHQQAITAIETSSTTCLREAVSQEVLT